MYSNVAGGTELRRRTSEQTVRYFSPTPCMWNRNTDENAHYCDNILKIFASLLISKYWYI